MSKMMKKVVPAVIITVVIFMAAAIYLASVLYNPVTAENQTAVNSVNFGNESYLYEEEEAKNIPESEGMIVGKSAVLDDYSDALNIGERVWYDENTFHQYPAGEDKNDISVLVEESRISRILYLKDLSSGFEFPIKPQEGSKYLLVKISAAPMGDYLIMHTSPATNSFELLDSSNVYRPLLNISVDMGVIIKNQPSFDTLINEKFVINNVGKIYVGRTIFSSLNDVDGSGPVSGWIIYEVPDSLIVSSDTYVKFSSVKDGVLWKLHDIRADTDLYINPESGNIRIVYTGGPDQYLVFGLEATLEKTDGSVISKSVEKGEDEESLSLWTELIIPGIGSSGELGGDELLTVKLIRLDGEKFVKYKKFV